MKLAVAIAAEDALSSAFVVWRGFEKSIKRASEFGYQGVELALKSADDINPAALKRWLDESKMEVSGISTGQVFSALGLYFTHEEKKIREEAVEVFKGLIHLAKDFGKIVNVGRARGFVGKGQSVKEAQRLFLETTEKICEEADKYEVTIIIEPVNRYEINFINNLDEGAQIISGLSGHNLGLMPDVFHMNIEDDNIGKSLIRNAQFIKYLHLADSNRLAPGQGHIDFREIFNALHQIKYDGWAAIEILPEPDPDQAARQAAWFMLPMIEEYNQKMKTGIAI